MKAIAIVGLRKRKSKPGAIAQIIIRLGSKANLLAARKVTGRPIQIGELVVTDFTRLLYAGGMKTVWLITLIGLTEKVCWGWAVGKSNDTGLALMAWQKLKRNRRRHSLPVKELIVHQDRDPVFTGYEWVGRLAEDGAVFSYTLNGFKGNPEIESFNGHFKGELKSLVADCRTPAEVTKVVTRQMRYYNWQRQHSSIDYLPPMVYFKSERSGKPRRKSEN
jgi:putative transposase